MKKMSKENIRELAEDNAIYEFNKFKKIYGNYADEYVRHFYNKLAELRSGIDDIHTCNCQRNNNSRENEPCCRCDSRNTNADRIRNMSDEELAEFIQEMANTCLVDFMRYADKDCDKISCRECRAKAPTILEWLQSKQNRREYGR